MNNIQVSNFLWCLTHIDGTSNLGLNSLLSVANDNESHYINHNHDNNHDFEIDGNIKPGNVFFAKIVAIVVLFSASALCGSIPFLLNRCFKWTENKTNARSTVVIKCLSYFGGGILLCTTFLHLLPEVQDTVNQLEECGTLPKMTFALSEMLMCGGFFLMYLVEEIIHAYIHRHKQQLQHDIAAFERSHSMRNSYLLKKSQNIEESAAIHKSSLNSIECPATISLPIIINGLLENNLDKKKIVHSQENLENQSERKDNLNLHHLHHHNHHQQQAHSHHHHHMFDYRHAQSHSSPDNSSYGEYHVATSLRGLLIVLALSLHELFEGMSIGLEGSASSVWFMFGAVSAHKLVLAFCVGVELIVARTRILLALAYVITFAIVSPIGIGIGILVSSNKDSSSTGISSAILQGLACGTLLYVVFFEILSNNRSGLLAYFTIILGFAVMFGLQSLGHLRDKR